MPTALRRLLDQRAQPLPPTLRNGLLAGAAVTVAVAAVWAWRSSGLRGSDLELGLVAASLLVAAPLSLGLKAAEYRVAAEIVDQHPSPGRCADVAVVSSAANLLPLPGSLLVTVRSLSEDGTSYGGAVTAGATPGIAWLGITGIVGGAAIAVEGPLLLGIAVIVGGVAASAGAATLLRRQARPESWRRLGAAIVAVEAGWLAVSALRLGLAVAALGVGVEPTQALALSVAGALTVAVGFFPGGLGVREALIAALAPVVGLPFDTGVLVGTLDRLVWLVFLAFAALVLMLVRRSR